MNLKVLSVFRSVSVSTRQFSNSVSPKFCIVGGGPAGFYAAQQLVKLLPTSSVDIYERLPVPFGLVRYGVAPDHPEVKNVINTFTKTAKNPNVTFVGNVSLGKDVSLHELQSSYHAVLLTYGAEKDSTLNVPGESLTNVLAARQFVGWYNGVPEDAGLQVDLTAEDVIVIGQGNVAVDVARILLSPIDKLKTTDITDYSLAQLAESRVRRVSLVGRRGPLQVALTIKELREILRLPDVRTVFNQEDFSGIQHVLADLPRPRKRLTELFYNAAMEGSGEGNKTLQFVFMRAPLAFTGNKKVEEMELGVTQLVGETGERQRAELTDRRETRPCGLALRSIGYKSIQAVPDLPFDDKRGVAINENGRITEGLYCSGWLSTGPMGVILSTMTNAFATAQLIHKDWVEKLLKTDESKPGSAGTQIVDFEGWTKIDQEEERRGKEKGKLREKIVNIEEMLKVAS